MEVSYRSSNILCPPVMATQCAPAVVRQGSGIVLFGRRAAHL